MNPGMEQLYTRQIIINLLTVIIPVMLMVQVIHRKHKTPEIKIFFRMCIFNLVQCLTYAVACFVVLKHTEFNDDLVFVVAVICNVLMGIIPLVLAGHWLLFVEYTLHQSLDIIRRRYPVVMIPFYIGVLITIIGIIVPIPESTSKQVMRGIALLNKLNFLIWCFYVLASYVLFYIKESGIQLTEEEQEQVAGGFLSLKDLIDIASRGGHVAEVIKKRFDPFSKRGTNQGSDNKLKRYLISDDIKSRITIGNNGFLLLCIITGYFDKHRISGKEIYMTFEVTALQDRMMRIEASDIKGACATLKISGDKAYLLFIRVPKGCRRNGYGTGLLEAAEAEAFAGGAKELICEYTGEATEFSDFLESCGYERSEAGKIYRVKGRDFLLSHRVRKSARITFPDMNTEVFEKMPMFRRDGVADFLTKHKYDMPVRDMDMYHQKRSFASFDKKYDPKAVILSALRGNDVVVELLFSVSSMNPRYILSVGQAFIKSLAELFSKIGEFDIFFYVHTDYVLNMITKLMDKSTKIDEVNPIMPEKTLAENTHVLCGN